MEEQFPIQTTTCQSPDSADALEHMLDAIWRQEHSRLRHDCTTFRGRQHGKSWLARQIRMEARTTLPPISGKKGTYAWFDEAKEFTLSDWQSLNPPWDLNIKPLVIHGSPALYGIDLGH